MYFGTYTFFHSNYIRWLEEARIDFMALFVAEEKNEYNKRPVKTYTGKGTPANAGSVLFRPNKLPNTIDNTIIVSNGSINVHSIPK